MSRKLLASCLTAAVLAVPLAGAQAQVVIFTPLRTPAPYVSAATVTTLAGEAGSKGSADGRGAAARFARPMGLAVDATGAVFVVDAESMTVRKITPAGEVTALAGTAGSPGSADGAGAAAQFHHPVGVALDASGTLYVTDADNHTIRKITASGNVTTLAGAARSKGSTDGNGPAARFNTPHGVAVGTDGVVYVADTYNHTIRKITPAGVVTTLAGAAGRKGHADGPGAAARFHNPFGIAVDGQGVVYVSDNGNNTIRRISAAGEVTTLAGTAGQSGSTDALGAAARFRRPAGLAVDANGGIYVAEALNSTIRRITAAGVVTTVAGQALRFGHLDGVGAAARFNGPSGVAVDASGTLYVSDGTTIRIIK